MDEYLVWVERHFPTLDVAQRELAKVLGKLDRQEVIIDRLKTENSSLPKIVEML